VPTHALRLKKHIENTIEQLRKEGLEEPSWEKIAEIVGGSADVVEATVAGSRATVSLSQPATPTERESLEARFRMNEDGEDPYNPEQPIAFAQIKAALAAAMNELDPVDRRIVELRMGT
jgi:DNA-directed RNA polymerase sigma subunit (sigma70/sigma32)